MSGKITTPIGEISVFVDGVEIEYLYEKGEKGENGFHDVLGRYFIVVSYNPDGNTHTIDCVVSCDGSVETDCECGEHLECQGFYSKNGDKLSIGTFGVNYEDELFDYTVDYLKNGMRYIIFPETKTSEYVFGICWIDDVFTGKGDRYANDREVQTWLGADPFDFIKRVT